MRLRRSVSPDFRIICKKAVAPLQTPIIILGGILVGVFTPTEASAIAVAYALIIAFFVLRSMSLRDLPAILTKAALSSRTVLLLVARRSPSRPWSASAMRRSRWRRSFWVSARIPDAAVPDQRSAVRGRHVLDAGPAIIILGPILGPIFVDLGVHPVHFAIIMSVNLTVGLATPPMGLVLFVASAVSGEKVETISKAILHFWRLKCW